MPHWNTVAIYGVGLIGGSIGLGLRRQSPPVRVIGIGRRSDRLQQAVTLGAISEYTTDLEAGVQQADLIVVCTPVQQVAEQVARISRSVLPTAWITDVGSTKAGIVAAVRQRVPQARFIGSHPLAGSEKGGVEHSRPDLFSDRAVVITEDALTPREGVAWVSRFWQALGGRVSTMTPVQHDRAVAQISHLPHVIASVLASQTDSENLPLAAGGWRDTTRVAAADVHLWTQILLENDQFILEHLQHFQQGLEAFESALADRNQDQLTRLLAAGKQRRDAVGN